MADGGGSVAGHVAGWQRVPVVHLFVMAGASNRTPGVMTAAVLTVGTLIVATSTPQRSLFLAAGTLVLATGMVQPGTDVNGNAASANHRFRPVLLRVFKSGRRKRKPKSSDFRDGTPWHEPSAGVEPRRKLRMPLRQRLWRPVQDLASLTSRAQRTGEQMGPLTEVPALVRIENDHWIFERIEASTLHELTHRLVLQTNQGEEVLGVTEDLATALEVARCMAENDQRVVLIQQI